MSVQGELLEMLETVADALGDDLRQQMVFVGGCSTAVLITDEITLQEVRATDDVDLIVGLTGMMQWMQLQQILNSKGFTVSGEDGLICRMRLGRLKVDFMPDDPSILGFSNRWYKEGIQTATKYVLPSGRMIKHLTAPLFLATKLEAYAGRGQNDPLGSHDLEDIINVVDGRPELVEEVRAASGEVRTYVAEQFQALLRHADFEYFLHGNIRGPEGRVATVRQRVTELSAAE
jgi:predicted nucleotidyltransferase